MDFLFTDSNNHVEFLKWIQTLDKDDYMLLVYILERLCPENKHLVQPMVPFYANHNTNRFKNMLNCAKAYVALMALSKHEFNIFEVAYLDPNPGSFWTAAAALFSQWLMFLILIIYHAVIERQLPNPGSNRSEEENFALVLLICLVSTFVFSKKAVRQWANCGEFIEIFYEMGRPAPVTFLLNRLANQLLSVLVLLFNVYFVIISENPSDAILNALALFFVVEVDDELVPDWDDEYTDDVKAQGFRGYLQHPLEPDALYTKIKHQGVPLDSMRHLSGPGAYSDNDKLYVDMNEDERKVTIWKAIPDHKSQLTIEHTRIDYYIYGHDEVVHEFFTQLNSFKCIRGLKDITDLCSGEDKSDHTDMTQPSMTGGGGAGGGYGNPPQSQQPHGKRGGGYNNTSEMPVDVEMGQGQERYPSNNSKNSKSYTKQPSNGLPAPIKRNDSSDKSAAQSRWNKARDATIAVERLGGNKWKPTMVRETVNCANCGKPRCIFSKNHLDAETQRILEQRIEMTSFVCGKLLFDDNETVGVKIAQRQDLSCDSPIEKAYYNPRKGRSTFVTPDLCIHCGKSHSLLRIEDLRNKGHVTDDLDRYPICVPCLDLGRQPIKVPKLKKKESNEQSSSELNMSTRSKKQRKASAEIV